MTNEDASENPAKRIKLTTKTPGKITAASPPNEIEITFLGTSAGKPTIQRNSSSLALRMDGQIWLFDCGEATTHQIMRTTLKASNVTRIFISHLHGDHVFGLMSFLAYIGDRDVDRTQRLDPHNIVEIYGPSGIRDFVRSNLRLTQTHSKLRVKIHELLRKSKDAVFSPSVSQPLRSAQHKLWHSELLGHDLWDDQSGVWRDIINIEECGISVSAAPIQHTVDCLGYVLKEANRREKFDMTKLKPILDQHSDEIKRMGFKVPPAILSHLEKTREPITFSTGVTLEPPRLSIRGRTIIILGDTSNPEQILTLINPESETVDLLIHESTGTSIPDLKTSTNEEPEAIVSMRMMKRGHSTSFMAGRFAHKTSAKKVILNHLGGKFPAPLGCLCPITQKTIFGQLIRTNPICNISGLQQKHASLWRSFDQLDPDRQEKIMKELEWMKQVETDCLSGWKQAATESVPNVKKQDQVIEVAIANDFMQVEIPRPDL